VLALALVAALVVAAWAVGRSGHDEIPCGLKPVLEPSRDAACPDDVGRVLRVLQFNIHFGINRSGELDLARLAAEVEAVYRADSRLNEVDRGTQRSQGTDEARVLAD